MCVHSTAIIAVVCANLPGYVCKLGVAGEDDHVEEEKNKIASRAF